MRDKIINLWRDYPYLNYLVCGLLLVLFAGLALSVVVFFVTGFQSEGFYREICFSNQCVINFSTIFSQSFVILKLTLDLLVGVAMVGGIVVALMSYLNSASATALSNHISHFSIFQSYLMTEISKRSRVSPSSVDVFMWYNLIFSNSRTGKTSISSIYCDVVQSLNGEIVFSNEQAKNAIQGSFRYVPHQERIIKALGLFGILLTHSPRNEFYEIEDQIFSLISSLNKSFCYSDSVPELVKRDYV